MLKRQKVKPITFRLYPEGSFLYCEVNVWPNKKAMLAHTRLGGTKYEASCGGREAYQVSEDGSTRKSGLFAEANFNRHNMGTEIMSHEMTHAAFAFADRRKLDLAQALDKIYQTGNRETMDIDGPEERFCYALGQMCKQFVNRCHKLGLCK